MIHLHTLGTARIDVEEGQIWPSSLRKFALFLYMYGERGHTVARSTLTELFFARRPETNASHSLREVLYQLREVGVRLRSTPEGIALLDEDVRSDFADAMAADSLTAEQVSAIAAGFLPGFAPTLSKAFTGWLETYRERSIFELTKVLVKMLRRARTVGDWATTERIARACLAISPFNEHGTFALAEALAIGGAKIDAATLLDRYMDGVGRRPEDLRLSAAILKRRIGERLPDRYARQSVMRFTGRNAEMLLLSETLDRARAGQSGCVVLCGEPGIGKSRIATEFTLRASLEGVQLVRATTQPHDAHRPMSAFVDLVPQLLQLPGALGCSPETMSTLVRLTKHNPLTADDPFEAARHSEAVCAAIIDAIGDLVDAIASECILILWLEDAQWLDEMSIQSIAHVVSERANRRLLVLLTSRDRTLTLMRYSDHASIVDVHPLDTQACRSLANEALGTSDSIANKSDCEWVVATAAGNPFFLACLLNHVLHSGERFTVPPTISALLDQRLAGLSSEGKTVLESCVLLGKHSTLKRIVATTELLHAQLVPAFRELEAARMIGDVQGQIQPGHWLIADCVQRNSTPIAMTLSHQRIAMVLQEESQRTGSPAMLWDCGEHWIAAGEVDRAIAVMKDCSRHLVEIGRPREATEMLLRAASLAGPAGGVDLTEAAVLLGSTAHEHELVLQGVSVLRSFGVPRRHDDIELAEFSSQTLATIDVHAAVERLRECLVSPLSSTEHRLGVAVPLIVLCHQHDLADFAAEAFAILNPLASDLEGGERLDALRFLLIYHSSFGDLDESTTIANELLAADGHWTTEIKSHIHRQAGIALWCAGRPNEAMLALHSAYSLAGERGLRRSQLAIASMCANFHSDLGNDIERDRWLAEADRLATGTAALQTGFDLVSIYIDIASAACDPSEMKKWYEAALEMGRPDGNIRLERWFQTLELLVRHLTGQLDAPTEAVRRLTEWKFGRTVSALADFELATALTIGRECESVDIRSDRLANYLVMRRGRMPLSAMLQGVARDLERERTRATGSD